MPAGTNRARTSSTTHHRGTYRWRRILLIIWSDRYGRIDSSLLITVAHELSSQLSDRSGVGVIKYWEIPSTWKGKRHEYAKEYAARGTIMLTCRTELTPKLVFALPCWCTAVCTSKLVFALPCWCTAVCTSKLVFALPCWCTAVCRTRSELALNVTNQFPTAHLIATRA